MSEKNAVITDFDKKYADYLSLIEENLGALIPDENTPQGRVASAMRHSLCGGGKRIRAVLTLEFCRMCGGSAELALPAACAVEMVHAFSLIHDDLPCMDNDDMRRGKPSCHKAFDEATALLAGDALAIYPFEIISECKAEPTRALKAIAVLANALGVSGMIGGQQIDTENDGKAIGGDALLSMYSMKTSALISAACKMGTILGGGDEKRLKAAGEYAEALGLAFQLVDDILDVTGDEKTLGKPTGSDSENDKHTYAAVYGLQKTREMAETESKRALAALDSFDGAEFITELTKRLLYRSK